MEEMKYKFAPLKDATHKELKVLSVNEDKTFDEMVEKLIESYKMFKKLNDYSKELSENS